MHKNLATLLLNSIHTCRNVNVYIHKHAGNEKRLKIMISIERKEIDHFVWERDIYYIAGNNIHKHELA